MSALTDIKKGIVIKYNSAPFVVMEANFCRMQQRKPVMQTKLKNIKTGQVVEYSFKQGEKVEMADITRRKVNYLYREGHKYFFMSEDDFDQFFIEKENLESKENFLTDSLAVNILYFEEEMIGVELPPKVDLKVIETPEGVKGNSAGNVTKTAELETGYKLSVPMFVNEGDVIRVNTETGEYVERA